MAHSISNFMFSKKTKKIMKNMLSDKVKMATSVLVVSKALLLSDDYNGHKPLSQISSWLRSRTSSIINTLIGAQEADLAVLYTSDMELDEKNDWEEEELLLGSYFPSTVDRMDKQLAELEEEVNWCGDELNIVYIAVFKLNSIDSEDVFDGPDFVKELNRDQRTETDPVMKLADDATEQEIEHFTNSVFGQVYFVPKIHLEIPAPCLQTTDSVDVLIDEDTIANFDVCIDLELDVTIAGEDVLELMGLGENNLRICKDDLRVPDHPDVEVIGEQLMQFQKGLKRVQVKIVFLRQVSGLHMSWFTAVSLGCLNI